MKFSNLNRRAMIDQLKKESFDVLVIGGGITGAGIALDAAARGMKTAVIEMQDFAAGTSSRSTKLIHGGLRYLKQFEVKIVAEVGKERAIVYENGPHVTTPEWMLLPIHQDGTFGKFTTSIGLRIYDFLAKVHKTERRTMLSMQETLNKEPLIKEDGLKGGGYYVEYRTDDARLTMEVMKAALEKGAIPLNYTKVDQLLYENGQASGVQVVDQFSFEKYEIKAKKIVNATGPWIDSIREKDGSKHGKALKLTKGVHLVIDQARFPLKQSVYFDAPDKRMIFAIPRDGKAYVGTTDTFFADDPISPKMTTADRSYLLQAIHYMFPEVKLTSEDIESSWAGVRPLILEEGKAPSAISRKDEIWVADSGLITIAGGKLTGYRKMAEMVVDNLAKNFNGNIHISPCCLTKDLPISGGDVGGSKAFAKYIALQSQKGMKMGLSQEEALHLVKMYGSNVPILFEMIERSESGEARQFDLPFVIWVKLKYALEYEMVATPVDFFKRRTGILLFAIDSVRKYQNPVIHYMAHFFGWDQEAQNRFKQELEQELIDASIPSDQQ